MLIFNPKMQTQAGGGGRDLRADRLMTGTWVKKVETESLDAVIIAYNVFPCLDLKAYI